MADLMRQLNFIISDDLILAIRAHRTSLCILLVVLVLMYLWFTLSESGVIPKSISMFRSSDPGPKPHPGPEPEAEQLQKMVDELEKEVEQLQSDNTLKERLQKLMEDLRKGTKFQEEQIEAQKQRIARLEIHIARLEGGTSPKKSLKSGSPKVVPNAEGRLWCSQYLEAFRSRYSAK